MPIRTEQIEQIGVITLDRPDRAHAYDRAHLDALEDAIGLLSGSARAIVVCSTGKRAFCAGADLNELRQADPIDALDLRSQRVFTILARSPAISIAAVQGPAVAGGCELALACDIRVVGPYARFSLPETALGIIPSAGGCTRLTRLIGPSRAKMVILAGVAIDAQRAVDWGLAMEIAPDPLARALSLAAEIGLRDPVALRLARQIIDRGEDQGSLEAERVSEALLYTRKAARDRAKQG